jgi:hypothetical protein
MAKKQSFADKASKKKHVINCPICESPINYIKFVKAVRTGNGWKFRTTNIGVCKCNHSEVYG